VDTGGVDEAQIATCAAATLRASSLNVPEGGLVVNHMRTEF
jgi:hypothetical protein